MEDFNLRDYNQHQLMKRAPTLITGPNLVFLAPTRKGLRSLVPKWKILLASNNMALLHNQPLLFTSISSHHCCSSQLLIIASQHYFWSLLLICPARHCCSSVESSLYAEKSFHCHTLLMYIIVHLIILNYWTRNFAMFSVFTKQKACIVMHHHHRYASSS